MIVTTAESFFIKSGYRARTQAEYYADIHDDGTVWQPDVYALAAVLARQYECKYIIDIGCGRAGKIAKMFPEFQIIGLDFGSNLEFCRQHYPFGNWIEVDLEAGTRVNLPKEILENAVVINADVIEHLVNPTKLLEMFKSFLTYAKVALVSTPERDLERGVSDFGPPANPTHMREWNLVELETLFINFGMRPAFCGLTISNDRHRELKTSLAILPGFQLNAGEVRDLGNFCAAWLQATPEQREAQRQAVEDPYSRELAQLQRQVDALAAAQRNAAPQLSLLEIGTARIDAGEFEGAFQVLSEALQKEPGNAGAVFQMGRLAAINNMVDDARELFYQSTLLSPDMVKAIVDFYTLQVKNARAG